MRTRSAHLTALMAGILSLVGGNLVAQSADPAFLPATTGGQRRTEIPPPGIAKIAEIVSPVALRSATEGAVDQLEAMDTWNREGRTPKQIGINRRLPAVIKATVGAKPAGKRTVASDLHSFQTVAEDGSTLWATRINVKDAFGIRLHLTGVQFPPGTQFWSYGTEGSAKTFGLELVDPVGDLWTPMSFGETSYLEIKVPPAEGGSLSLFEVAEIRPLVGNSPEPACAIDAICVNTSTFSTINYAVSAVALIGFQTTTGSAGCTATLINDKAQDFKGYLLTANHCISTQAEASSVEAIWDYHAPACGGAVPPLSSRQSSNGSSLLASSSVSDFSFLLLSSSVPAPRYFMGWDTTPPAAGTTLFRVAFPDSLDKTTIYQEQFSTYSVDPTSEICLDTPRPDFIYSRPESGYAYEGASGSAVILDDGRVVGQLLGTCPATSSPCTYNSWEAADGSLAVTYPAIAQWLNNGSTGGCTSTMTSLCLDNRFTVTAGWQKSDGTSGQGTAISLTSDTGYFWFFDPTNIEVVTKVLNGCSIDNHYWVFGSGLTNVGVTLTVTDTSNNTVATYHNPVGAAFQPVQDTSALATCP